MFCSNLFGILTAFRDFQDRFPPFLPPAGAHRIRRNAQDHVDLRAFDFTVTRCVLHGYRECVLSALPFGRAIVLYPRRRTLPPRNQVPSPHLLWVIIGRAFSAFGAVIYVSDVQLRLYHLCS